MLYTYCKANMQRGPWPCKNAPCLWLYREACRYLEKYRSSRHPASQTSLVTATSLISLNEPLLQIRSKLDVTSQLSDDGDQSTKCSDPRTIIYYVAL